LRSAHSSETRKMSKQIVDTAIATAVTQSRALRVEAKRTGREKKTAHTCFAVVTAREGAVHHHMRRIRAHWLKRYSHRRNHRNVVHRLSVHGLACGRSIHRLRIHRLTGRRLTVHRLTGRLAVHRLLIHRHRSGLHGLGIRGRRRIHRLLTIDRRRCRCRRWSHTVW